MNSMVNYTIMHRGLRTLLTIVITLAPQMTTRSILRRPDAIKDARPTRRRYPSEWTFN